MVKKERKNKKKGSLVKWVWTEASLPPEAGQPNSRMSRQPYLKSCCLFGTEEKCDKIHVSRFPTFHLGKPWSYMVGLWPLQIFKAKAFYESSLYFYKSRSRVQPSRISIYGYGKYKKKGVHFNICLTLFI